MERKKEVKAAAEATVAKKSWQEFSEEQESGASMFVSHQKVNYYTFATDM